MRESVHVGDSRMQLGCGVSASLVTLEVAAPTQSHTANVTDERPLARVRALVRHKTTASRNHLSAAINVTDAGSLARVSPLVADEVKSRSERSAATFNFADKGRLPL